MASSDGVHIVAKLQSATTIEGAFRVHLPPDSLDHARLKVGEVCSLVGDDGTSGLGIAWRADDRMGKGPKNRPIKMSEILQSVFGFKEGAKVTVSATSKKIVKARQIILEDVEQEASIAAEKLWRVRTHAVLGNCEALAAGMTFDVASKKKIRRKFRIGNIKSDGPAIAEPFLFSVDDETQIVLPGFSADEQSTFPSSDSSKPARNAAEDPPLELQTLYEMDKSRIGGLVEQCQQLNEAMQQVLNAAPRTHALNYPILIHGYEGTGKSMLLDQMARAPFRKVLRLDRQSVNSGITAKNQATIRDTFKEALDTQPAIILMDNLEELAPNDDATCARTIAHEARIVQGARVLLVAATRKPSELSNTVRGDDCFVKELELPIPDQAAREQVLKAICPGSADPTLYATIAERTHGFTCKDLQVLRKLATERAWHRAHRASLTSGHKKPTGLTPEKQAGDQVSENSEGKSGEHAAQQHEAPPIPTLSLEGLAPDLADFEEVLLSQRVTPTALRELFTEKPKVRWSDIGGSQTLKETFDTMIGWPLEFKDYISTVPGFGSTKGVLLYGPPGCSKTLTAQAVANTYNLNFIAIKGAELISMYVGESERAVRDVFAKARLAAPCVIFFDEIDSIGGDRDGAGGGGSAKGLNVLTTLLNEMDGFEPLRDVFVLAATNKPASLDPALVRPGRFDAHVYLGPPAREARREILEIALRGLEVNGSHLEEIAHETEGYSGAEIVQICHKAVMAAVGRNITAMREVKKSTGVLPPPPAVTTLTKEDLLIARRSVKKSITPEMIAGFLEFAAARE